MVLLLSGIAGCGEERETTQETAATTAAPTVAPVETFAPNGEVVEVKAIDNNFVQQSVTVVAGMR